MIQRLKSEVRQVKFTDQPQALAAEIDDALRQFGIGGDDRLFQSIKFFEGELKLISRALKEMHERATTRA